MPVNPISKQALVIGFRDRFGPNGPLLTPKFINLLSAHFQFSPTPFLCTKISTLFGGESIDLRDLEKKKKSNHTQRKINGSTEDDSTRNRRSEKRCPPLRASRCQERHCWLSSSRIRLWRCTLFSSEFLFCQLTLILSDSSCSCVFWAD